jgi:hypothetical protein
MSTNTAIGVESRILSEGYGPGAWHGADLKAAIDDVTAETAYWRPSAGRHNIAEIALHHAYCARSVRSQLSGRPAEPFALSGEDWFDLPNEGVLAWPRIQAVVQEEQEQLARLVADIEAGTAKSAMTDEERFGLVLGITCHAVYHAGQIQLIKRGRRD